MNLGDIFGRIIRGEFEIIGRNRKGEIVYEYRDHNVVVDDARPTTAYLLCQAITGQEVNRPEYDNDGFTVSGFRDDLINSRTFQVSFIKMGGGFPRKRSFCNTGGEEIPLVPAELSGLSTRSSLYTAIAYGSTATDTIPADWTKYGSVVSEQPYNTSSLLYPRKTDTDILDRDYQWSKRIAVYSYENTATSAGFKANFVTTMRFTEGNGPEFDCNGVRQGDNQLYEYREAGLYVGAMPWQFGDNPASETDVLNENKTARHPKADLGEIFGASDLADDIDSTLTTNLREYRYWDGDSELIGASYGTASPSNTPAWPKKSDGSYLWENSLQYRNWFRSMDGSTSNSYLQGELFRGNYMVARKTFPVITKTKDLEFTVKWSLVFG